MKRLTVTIPVLAGLIALLLPATITAEPIDLETSVALALRSNLGIESELAAVRQKKLIADTWWNRFYPSIGASYTLSRSNNEPESPGFGVPAPSRWSMGAGLDVSLSLTPQMVPGITLARLDYENGLITLDEARAEVERDVSKQFYQLLLLQEQIALQEEQIQNAQRRYEQAQINYENGLIDEYNLLSSQVGVENLRPALAGLEVSYQQALLAFRNSLGLPLNEDVAPVGEIEPPELEVTSTQMDTSVLRQRFDIQQLEMAAHLIREQRNATASGPQGRRMPSLRFGLSVSPGFAGDPFGDNWLDGDLWNDNGRFSITISQPLDGWIPFSQTSNQLSDFDTQLEQNRLTVEQALRGAEIGVRGLLLQIRTGQQTVEALSRNVELARRAYELAEVGYNNGLRDLLEVQTAELDLRDAELNLLKEKKNIMDSVLDLEYELNATLDEIREMQE